MAKDENNKESVTPTTIDLNLGLVPDELAGYLGATPPSAPVRNASGGKSALLAKQRQIKKMEERPQNFEAFSGSMSTSAKKLAERLGPQTPEDLMELFKIL